MKADIVKALVLSVMWISCAVAAIIMKDSGILIYAVFGTVLFLGFYS